MVLPEQFKNRMRNMLGDEYQDFIDSYEMPRQYGLRVNTLKVSPEEFGEMAPFPVERIPWIKNGFFYKEGIFPARHPYYAAGVYYLQEPSAMTPASRLPVEPGDRVLDLCAAPGGKATELAARLKGKGVLVANDISNSRARALLHNLELFGAANIFVTNEIPARLAESFPGYFDKILVDAPCSGEGMFRKDPDVIGSWSSERVDFFAKQQRSIVKSAVEMLRPGGVMLYSTCTFSAEENEGTVGWLLEQNPELELLKLEPYEGFSEGKPEWGGGNETLSCCVRIWPHRMNGEGHFMALLRKRTAGSEDERKRLEQQEKKQQNRVKRKKKEQPKAEGKLEAEEKKHLEAFLREGEAQLPCGRVESRGGKAYLVPELPDSVKGIRFLRNGLYLGEFKKGRFEPSEAYAMYLSPECYSKVLSFGAESEQVEMYLRGETVFDIKVGEKCKNGWNLVCVDKFSLGWGKLSNGVLKNKYLCSWRKN